MGRARVRVVKFIEAKEKNEISTTRSEILEIKKIKKNKRFRIHERPGVPSAEKKTRSSAQARGGDRGQEKFGSSE